MTDYPINIDLNVKGEGSLKSLVASLENIETTSKESANGIKLIAEALGSVKGGDGLKKIVSELQNINKASSETANSINKLDFSKMSSNIGKLKSIDTTLKDLLRTVESLKSSGNIRLDVTSNASTVSRELNNLNRVSNRTRKHTYRTGSRNGYNYYGFNADENPYYQKAAPITAVGRNMQRIGEKAGLVGANLMMAGSFLGVKELSDTIIETPARAETQKYLLQNMQGSATITGEGGGTTTLYKTLDKTTDALPISMQNVVQPLYAFKAASGATAQEINDIIPEFANFGAQVINMTGSEDQAEEAMQKLSRAYQGQYAAVDQYGITKEALEKVGYQEGGTIEEFMDAVTKITGDAKESMNNFNGMKALVGKDFSRAGKQLWNNGVGQAMSALVGGFHTLDSEMGGFSTQLIVGAAGFLDLATTATTVVGSIGTTIGTFGQMYGNLQMIRKNGGGITGAIKGIFDGVNSAGIYGNGAYGGAEQIVDNGAMRTAVYEGSLQGTTAGMRMNNVSDAVENINPIVEYDSRQDLDDYLYPRTKTEISRDSIQYKPTKDSTRAKNRANNQTQLLRYNEQKERFGPAMEHIEQKNLQLNASRMFDDWERQERNAIANVKNGFLEFPDKSYLYDDEEKKTKKKNKLLAGTNKVLGKFGSALGFLASPTGALTGLGIASMAAMGWINYASAHSDKVKDSTVNLSRAFGNLGTKVGSMAGNFFKSIGLSSTGGLEGAFEGTANALNNLAMIINNITGYTPEKQQQETAQERDNKLKQEADKTGKGFLTLNEKEFANADYMYNPATKRAEPVTDTDYKKVEAMHNQKYWGHLTEFNAQFMDGIGGIFGQDWGLTEKARQVNAEQENLIKSGDTQRLDMRQNLISSLFGGGKLFLDNGVETREANNAPIIGPIARLFNGLIGSSEASLAPGERQAEGRAKRDASERASALGSDNTSRIYNPQPNQQQQQQSGMSILNKDGQSPMGDGTQQGTQWGGQFMAGLQQAFTSAQLSLDQLFGGGQGGAGGGQDMLMKGTDWGNQLVNGLNTSLSSATIDTSGMTAGLDGAANQMGEKGTTAGNNYQNNFKTGVDGTSGIAQGEADAVVAALQTSIEGARAAGEAAGSAYHEGFESKADTHSPGIAARTALQEAKYLVEFLHTGVSGARLAGERTAYAYTSSIATLSGHTANGLNVAESIGNTLTSAASGVNSLVPSQNGTVSQTTENGYNNKNNTTNINVHIDKIDTKERVREIAETLVHIMTFNNETAGRNTDVGL